MGADQCDPSYCKHLVPRNTSSMYLLSPEAKTVFIIPGVEIVHTIPAGVKLPMEPVKKEQIQEMMVDGKMQPPSSAHLQGGRKRQNLSLDLTSAPVSKKSRVQNLLTSPDVQMLKLTSPELEKFLNQNPTKCRKRKLEKISHLEGRVQE